MTDGFLASLRAQTREYVGASISGNSYKGRIYGERADDKGGERQREEMWEEKVSEKGEKERATDTKLF